MYIFLFYRLEMYTYCITLVVEFTSITGSRYFPGKRWSGQLLHIMEESWYSEVKRVGDGATARRAGAMRAGECKNNGRRN